MGRPKGTKNKKVSTSSTFSQESKPPIGEDEEQKVPLQELKDKHVEEKKIAEAEKQSKYQKKKRLIAEEQEKQTEQLSQGLTLLGGTLLEILCVRLPNPKPPTDIEKMLFGNALSEVSAKYVPSLVAYAPEAMFIVTLAAVVLPRIKPVDSGNQLELPLEVKTKKDVSDGLTKSGTESHTSNGENGQRENETNKDVEKAMVP